MVPAKGAGAAAAAMLRVAVLLLVTVPLVPCDTSPGGLLTTMTPRSTYKTVTPAGCGRPRACLVAAESIRVRDDPAAAAALARGPSRRRALTELPRPGGTSSDNPIGSIPRGAWGSIAEIGNWQLCVLFFVFHWKSENESVVADRYLNLFVERI